MGHHDPTWTFSELYLHGRAHTNVEQIAKSLEVPLAYVQ